MFFLRAAFWPLYLFECFNSSRGERRFGLTFTVSRVIACVYSLDEDVEVEELFFVVDLLESVEISIVGLSIGVELRFVVAAELPFDGPLAVDEAHVA